MWSDRDPIVVELRMERQRQGLTLKQVASRMGWSVHGPLFKLESGMREPNLRTLRRWADALGRDVGLLPPKER